MGLKWMQNHRLGVRSPLDSKPLRNPGESIDRQIEDLVLDEICGVGAIATFLVAAAVLEWLRWYKEIPPNPWLYSCVAVIAVGICIRRLRKHRKLIRCLKLGRDGEKSVGQELERFRASGAQVLHDIPCDGFNIDHVLIHKTGLYVVETKTHAKPNRGAAKLFYDGKSITLNGRRPNRDPIAQVRSARRWLMNTVKNSTGMVFPTHAVVVYPGWYVHRVARTSDVSVLNPKELSNLVSRKAVALSADEVNLCAFHIGRYVRVAND